MRSIKAKLNCTREYLLFQENKTISIFLLEQDKTLLPFVEISLDYEPSSCDFYKDILVIGDKEEVKIYAKEETFLFSNSFTLEKKILALSFLPPHKLLLATLGKIFLYDWRTGKNLAKYYTSARSVYASTLSSFIFPYEREGKVVLRREEEQDSLLYTVSKKEVVALELNKEGTLFATASSNGKTIKVWNLAGECLYSCRRGNTCASIFSLSLDKGRLALTSNKTTVHIFQLREKSSLAQLTSYLSYSLSDYLQSTTSTLQINSSPLSYVFLWHDKIILVSPEGKYLEYGNKESFLLFKERK